MHKKKQQKKHGALADCVSLQMVSLFVVNLSIMGNPMVLGNWCAAINRRKKKQKKQRAAAVTLGFFYIEVVSNIFPHRLGCCWLAGALRAHVVVS